MKHFFKQYQFFFQLSVMLSLLPMPGAFAAEALQATKIYVSANEKTTVIELYTSEGCSSCPPADAWLSKLRSDSALFKSYIPLAFHVDYWNQYGWKDPFATSQNSARQRLHKQQGHTRAVYTPGFIIDGREWRGFFKFWARSYPPIASEKHGPKPGKLQLTRLNNHLTLSFMPLEALYTQGNQSRLIGNFVYLGTDIKSPVRAGENKGKTLLHDFVVLSHTYKIKGEAPNGTRPGSLDWQINIKAPPHATAVAAWISAADDLTPIQAVGGWL